MWAFSSFFGRVDMMQNLRDGIIGQGLSNTITSKREADIKVLDIFLSVTEIQL